MKYGISRRMKKKGQSLVSVGTSIHRKPCLSNRCLCTTRRLGAPMQVHRIYTRKCPSESGKPYMGAQHLENNLDFEFAPFVSPNLVLQA